MFKPLNILDIDIQIQKFEKEYENGKDSSCQEIDVSDVIWYLKECRDLLQTKLYEENVIIEDLNNGVSYLKGQIEDLKTVQATSI